MITRRHFNTGLAAGLSLITIPEIARADGLATVRLGNAAGIIDPQLIFCTMGQHPKLKYYEQQGCKLEILNMSGVGQTLQAIATGNVETSAVSPVAFLNVYAKNPGLDVIFPYCWLRQPHWSVAVKPDSPIKSLAELKGKKVGIRNQGDTGYFGARAMFAELKIDPDKDVEWVSVGDGGPAGQAVYSGRIDAMAFWDGSFARIEIAGFPLRHLPNTPGMQHLFGNAYAVRKSDLGKRRDLYVGFFRAMAMSTVFSVTNPDLAIRMHWDIYPESKPKGKTDAQAFEEAKKVVNSRKDKWLPGAWQADKRFGAMTEDEWRGQVHFAGLDGKIHDVKPVFTNDLLDDINKFDRKAIEKQAREMKA